MLMQEEETITVKEAAEILGVSLKTVRDWVQEGQLKGTIIPSSSPRVRVRKASYKVSKADTYALRDEMEQQRLEQAQ